MKWGIIGAMASEVALIREEMEQVNESRLGQFVFWDGTLYGHPVTLVQCGIGKVNAAITTQQLIDRFGVEQVINTGIAGAVHPELKVLDVVLSRQLCYHDFDMDFLREYPPFLESIQASELLVEQALEAFERVDHGSSCCFVGRIATGDQFVESSQQREKIIGEHHPMCVEMEGAAVGHTCLANGIPFLVIRTMSDNADEDADQSACNFEQVAAKHSSDIVLEMLRNS